MNILQRFSLICIVTVAAGCTYFSPDAPKTKETSVLPEKRISASKDDLEIDRIEDPSAGADNHDPSVFLDVDFAILKLGREPVTVKYTFVLTITNVSKSDITIPTRSVDGEPCCWMSGFVDKGVSYHVGTYRIGDHLIVPSPLKFFPAVLHPGESTEFARYSYDIEAQHPLKSFSADLTVDKNYGKAQGWWTGSVRVQIDLTKRKPIDPDF